jgi:hypothetical protein
VVSIFPFREGEWYSLGQLRDGVKAVLNQTHSDEKFRQAMRVNDQRRVPWAKSWMEEIYPSSLLADRLGLADDATFCWTPNGAADVEFRSTGGAIKIQCTTAYPHWPNSLGKQGGHLHKLEMRELNEKGYMFPGGGISKATAQDVETDLETVRVAIADALAKKINPGYDGCWLLVYVCGATSAFLDADFREVVVPSTERVGRAKWEAVFEGLYILGDQPANFAEVRNNRGQ